MTDRRRIARRWLVVGALAAMQGPGCVTAAGAQIPSSPVSSPRAVPVPAPTAADSGTRASTAAASRDEAPPAPAPAPFHDGPSAQEPGAALPGDGWEVGLASFYGDALSGRRTTSGERYRHARATCAHRSAPLGSMLEVERRDTGQRVRCRVNDRGPWVPGRVVDVSRSLAEGLGMLEIGVVEVRVRAVAPDEEAQRER